MKRGILTALILCQATVSFAGETKGSGELGATIATGNSDILTINAKLAVEYAINENWGSNAKLDILNSNNAGSTTAEKYELNYEANYKISNNPYYYGALNLRTDRIGGLSLSTALTGGVGYTFMKSDKASLKAKTGFGFRNSTDTSDVDTSEAIYTAEMNYLNQLSKITSLTTDFSLESGASNTFIKVDLGLQVSMAENLAFKYSIGTKTNSTVESGVDKTDVLQTVNLVYGF